eukprot:s384_g19.t1
MGTGASSTLKNATGDELKTLVNSLPKEDVSKLSRAIELVDRRPRGVQQMCSQHSTLRFDASRAVPKKVIIEILEALRSVPSSANTQPWTIVVLQGDKKAQVAAKLVATLEANDAGTTEYADLPSAMIPRMEKAVTEYQKDQQALEGTKSAIASAPLHVLVTAPVGPCLKEEPPVDGVYLDMGSAMTAISMCAHDMGLGVHPEFAVAKYGSVYKEVLGDEFPEEWERVVMVDHFVICGISLGYAQGGDPQPCPSRLPVDETTRCWAERKRQGFVMDELRLSMADGASHPSVTFSIWFDAARVLEALLPHPGHVQSGAQGRRGRGAFGVGEELISDVLAAARFVTSIANSQPWAVTVIQGEARDKLSMAMLDYFDAGNNGGQSYKKYSTQNTARMQKGKDQYGFELYEQRHGLQRDDAEGRRQKYRPNYEPPSSLGFWGAPVLLLLNLPKSSVAGTFVDVGSFMYGILVAMHSYGLGGKPLGSVAKFTELCREVLGEAAMPVEEHLVCGICIGWPKDGRDPREMPDWFPSRLAMDETTHFVSNSSKTAASSGPVGVVVEVQQAAVASVEAVPCLGDEEDSRDPERSAKRIHWLISRLQMQGYNRPVETQAPVQSSMADLLEIAKREQLQDGLNAEASETGENLTSTASEVGENLTSTEHNTQNTEKDKEEDVQDDLPLDLEEKSVQIFDAVTDPVLGYVSATELKRRRGGVGRDPVQLTFRTRPFMLSGSWLLAGCFIALFTPPQTGAGSGQRFGKPRGMHNSCFSMPLPMKVSLNS